MAANDEVLVRCDPSSGLQMADERQRAEVEALEAIYGEDYGLAKTKTAWAKANAVHEFVIRVRPLEETLRDAVAISIHFKLSANYPRVAPSLAVEKPLGLTADVVSSLEARLKAAASSKEMLGTEMCFELCSLAAQIITDKHAVVQGQTSLRHEAEQREERDRKELEDKRKAQLEQERVEREKEHARLNEMLQQDRERRVRVVEPPASAKRNASTRLTASNGRSHTRVPVVQIQQPFEMEPGVLAKTVIEGSLIDQTPLISICHGEAYSDDMREHRGVSMHVVELPQSYLTSASTKKKMQVILDDLKTLRTLSHPHLQRIYASQLSDADEDTRLEIIAEPHCQTSLETLLNATGPLTEERAMAYMRQLAAAIAELHAHGLTHNNPMPDDVQLCGKKAAEVKLVGISWVQRVIDMNRSEPFAPEIRMQRHPQGWLAPETSDSIMTYSRQRDMWDIGRLFLLMLLGIDAMTQYDSCYTAMQSEDYADLSDEVADILEALLEPNVKKRATASRLVTMLDKASAVAGPVSPSVKTVRPLYAESPSALPSVKLSSPEAPNVTTIETRASYFWQPRQQAASQISRYRTDFEEVEFLGKGGFGQVVKARARLDGSYYAIKKIKLPSSPEAEQKLLREVTIWSRMSHPHIVRYHTSWVEEEKEMGVEVTETSHSLNASMNRSSQSSTSSHPDESLESDDGLDMGLDDLDFDDVDFLSVSRSASYPSIRFANDGDPSNAPTPDDSDSSAQVEKAPSPMPPSTKRTLYIQMEYVGGGPTGQTLREAIDAGMPEEESWRLIRQLLSAMQHLTSIAIIHRDLKPSNIFLDAHGDIRVGDLGLAVGPNSFCDPSHPAKINDNTDLTSDVGTSLYVAPETASRGAGAKAHGQHQHYTNKIDMYSLGIVMFEMWHAMSTGMERVHSIRDLRTPQIKLPTSWKGNERQTQILKWLLTHDPSKRASPTDLLQSDLLPSTGRNEAVENVLQLLRAARSPHRGPIISALVTQTSDERIIRDLTYDPIQSDNDAAAELESYIGVVTGRLRDIFERRGAIYMPGDAIVPLSDLYENAGRKPYKVLDTDGNVLMLPYDLTVPFARKVARDTNLGRLKRWTVGQVYRPRPTGGPPEAITAASFDIVSAFDTLASEAETLQVLDEVASSFPLTAEYIFVMNHASLFEYALEQVPTTARASVARILETFSKKGAVPWPKIANELYKQRDLTRRVVDSLAAFHTFEDAASAVARLTPLEHTSTLLRSALTDIRELLCFCQRFGMTRPIKIWPLFLANRTHFERGGIGFQLSQLSKLGDVLAVGGRYDRLLARFAPLNSTAPLPHHIGASIAVAKLAQAARQDSLTVSQRMPPEYGSLTPRRCDVYVVSYAGGLLETRMQVVAQLWQSGIAADLVYDEKDWSAQSPEQAVATWRKEGILFVVNVKQHSASGDQIVRVRNVLRGGEEDVSPLELSSYLLERLAEQGHAARGDTTLISHATQSHRHHDLFRPNTQNVHFIVGDEPGARKQRARNRQLVTEKAVEQINSRLDNAESPPVFAVDVDGEAFRLMSESSTWLTRDEAFRALVAAAPATRKQYLSDVRAALQAHKLANPKSSWIWLFSMRESISTLLSL